MTRRRPFVLRTGMALMALSLLAALAIVAVHYFGRGTGPTAADAQPGTSATASGGAAQPSAATALGGRPSPSTSGSRSAGSGGGPGAGAIPTSFPNAANTGVPHGKTLKASNGTLTVSKAGAVIDGLDIRGDVNVTANNVTIRNSRVITSGTWAIIQRAGVSGLTVKDSEVHGNGSAQLQFAVFNLGGMLTLARNDFSVVSDAISTSEGLIVDNYLHDPKYFSGDHTDMIQSDSGPPAGRQLVIRHNTVINTIDQTSAIALFQDFGVQHDALIENNLLAGGGYALYAGAGSKGTSYNIKVINNVFGRQVFPKSGQYGPVAYWDSGGSGNVWQSNVWADTHAPVTP